MSDARMVVPDPEEFFPTVSTDYVDIHGVLDSVLKLVDPTSDVPPGNVLLSSIHGLGKSLLCANVAVRLGEKLGKKVPYIPFDCSEDTRDYHLRGSFSLMPDGGTAFIPGPFPLVIELANRIGVAILCLEEISALTPGAQKQCNCLTDWRTGVYVPQLGRNVALKPGCKIIVMASMNPSGYAGVYSLNEDLRSRFDEVVIPLPNIEQEKTILKMVCPFADAGTIEKAARLAKESRTNATEYKLSTRDLVKLLYNLRRLNDPKVALTLVANKYENEAEKALIVDRIKAVFQVQVS